MNCKCKEILEAEFGRTVGKIYVHLLGCPEDFYSKKWAKMKWWQKIFNPSPKSLYKEHLKVIQQP